MTNTFLAILVLSTYSISYVATQEMPKAVPAAKVKDNPVYLQGSNKNVTFTPAIFRF